jgi:hypothetical protein
LTAGTNVIRSHEANAEHDLAEERRRIRKREIWKNLDTLWNLDERIFREWLHDNAHRIGEL